MVVKDRVGRRRYILARVQPGMDRDALEGAIRRIGSAGVRLRIIDRRGDLLLVRCGHTEADEARRLLNAGGLTTIVTSGTISGAERRARERGIAFRARRRGRRDRRPRP